MKSLYCPLLPTGTLWSALAWPMGACQILPCPKYPCFLGSSLSGQTGVNKGVTCSIASGDINQTIQCPCPWVPLGPATSRVFSLTRCPLVVPFSSHQPSCRANSPSWTFKPPPYNPKSLSVAPVAILTEGLSFPPCSGVVLGSLLQRRRWRKESPPATPRWGMGSPIWGAGT